MASEAVENYLRQIYLAQERSGDELVSMGVLADTLGVVPGTVTTMIKRLAKQGLVAYEPYSGVGLTDQGRAQAVQLIRRHRLVESFLVRMLQFDWGDIHDEADRLEHAISERMLDRIDHALGRPTHDPHGDPIPSASGEVPITQTSRLVDCTSGEQVTIARVLDQGSDFLDFIAERGLRPPSSVVIRSVDRVGDAMVLELADTGDTVVMGTKAAGKLLVEKA